MDKKNITLKERMVYELDKMQKNIDGLMISGRDESLACIRVGDVIQEYATDLRYAHDRLRNLVRQMEKHDAEMDL